MRSKEYFNRHSNKNNYLELRSTAKINKDMNKKSGNYSNNMQIKRNNIRYELNNKKKR